MTDLRQRLSELDKERRAAKRKLNAGKPRRVIQQRAEPMAAGQREPRERNNAYLQFIRRQPCQSCGATQRIHAAHVRSGYPEAGWRPTGMQEKPSDFRTLPLCVDCHIDGRTPSTRAMSESGGPSEACTRRICARGSGSNSTKGTQMKHARDDYNRIQDPDGLIPEDEPVFLIRGKDRAGPAALRAWAKEAKAVGAHGNIVGRALTQADRMEAWQAEHGWKVPDL